MALPTKSWTIALTTGGIAVLAALGAVLTRKSKDEREIDRVDSKVRSFRSALASWNLKYQSFPDVRAWIDKNWTPQYGREAVEELLSRTMAERADDFWGVRRDHFREAQASKAAEKRYRNTLNDLRGDAFSKAKAGREHAAREVRSLPGVGGRLQRKGR